MLAEPGKYRAATDESFRFLTLNHAPLSYTSALGAHRTRIDDETVHQLVLESHRDSPAFRCALSAVVQSLYWNLTQTNIDDSGVKRTSMNGVKKIAVLLA